MKAAPPSWRQITNLNWSCDVVHGVEHRQEALAGHAEPELRAVGNQ